MDFNLLETYKKRLAAVVAAYKNFKPDFEKKIQYELIGQGFLNQTTNGIPEGTSVNIIAENETQYQIENPLAPTETVWIDKSLLEKSPASLAECIAKAKDIAVFGFTLPAGKTVEDLMFNDTSKKIPENLAINFVNIPKDAIGCFNNFIAEIYTIANAPYTNSEGKNTTGEDKPLDKNSTFKIVINFGSQPQIEKFDGEAYYFSFTTIESKNNKLLLVVCNEGKVGDENTKFISQDVPATAQKLKKSLNVEIKPAAKGTKGCQDMSTEQQAVVLGAVDALPSKFQNMIKGIDIELNTTSVNNYTQGAAGHYLRKQQKDANNELVEKRVLQLSDVAFEENAQRMGVSKKPSFYVFHELGHVIDAYPAKQYITLSNKKNKKESEQKKEQNAGNQDKANLLYKEVETLWDELAKIKSTYESTTKKNTQYLFSNNSIFTTALKNDKEKNKQTSPQNITLYADVSDEEAFCESFALYMTDKSTFKLLSPNVFAFIDNLKTTF